MSFRVFAAGLEDFHYSQNNNADGDVFEAAAVMSAVRSAGAGRIGVASSLASSEPRVMRDGIRGIARMNSLQILRIAVTRLATCTGARQGRITVSARRSRLAGLWPDASGFARYNFMPNANPCSDFMQRIIPTLEATDMNNYGVLNTLAIVLSDYHAHIGRAGRPMIQIHLLK